MTELQDQHVAWQQSMLDGRLQELRAAAARVENNQALKARSMHLLNPAVTFVQGLSSHLWMRSFVHSCILSFVLICAVLCCAVLCCAVLCCAVLRCAVL